MFKNYFKTAWRNFAGNKTHSFINVAGLAAGLACSLLIMLWIQSEKSTDAFHANGERLYRAYEREYYTDHIDGNSDTPGLLAEELKKQVPEIEDAIAMQEDNHDHALQYQQKTINVNGIAAGQGLFTMFSYPLLQGSAANALASPSNITISRKTAVEFFGSPQNAMGKTLGFDNNKQYIVSAVFEDLPENTSRRFDFVINWQGWLKDNTWATNWGNSGPLTYVLLRKDAKQQLVDNKISGFLYKFIKNDNPAYHVEYGLQKFGDVYLHGQFKDGKIAGGRIEYVRLFNIIAVFILLIACINFMNLTTARSLKRAKEVGVRKTVGALRSTLIQQFIGESLLLTMAAVIAAFALTILLLPIFNQVTQKHIVMPYTSTGFWLQLFVLTLVTGLVSGSYPALFLSSFNPTKVLKSAVKLSNGAVWFRKGLVVFQFVLSIVLITGTIVVSKQIAFIQHRNLGYDRENLIYVPIVGELKTKYATLKQAALQLPGVQGISRISDNPSFLDQQTNGVHWEGQQPGELVSFEHPDVGYDFATAMKIGFRSGRDFSQNHLTDKDAVLINETAAEKMGYKNAVGRGLTVNGHKVTIIGVLKDFHFRSLHEQIQPMIIELSGDAGYGYMLVRTQPGKTKQAINSLEALCKQLNPQFPFTYTFSDDEYQKLYNNEQVVGALSNAFSILAIFISCLGLLGLVMFTAAQRTKEIGVRKVLGASAAAIVKLISIDFLKLVFIAILIATPVAWWAMSEWLNDYAYKINIGWLTFLYAGGLAIIIAVCTISFHAIKSAMANPVRSLRSE